MSDLIDRQAAIKDAESWVAVDEHEKHLQKNVVEWLKEFPPAEPQTGEWLLTKKHRLVDETDDGGIYNDENYWYCSNCGHGQYMYSKPNDNYCPNCGCKMEVEHDSV